MDRASRDRQRVPLEVAAAVVFFRVTGLQVEGRRDPAMLKSLDAVARALANIMPIYAEEPPDRPKELSAFELLEGKFERGARIFRMRDGRELEGLAVERRDMLAGIAVLRAAGIRFD